MSIKPAYSLYFPNRTEPFRPTGNFNSGLGVPSAAEGAARRIHHPID
jgi:hypothetical protein